MTRKEEICDVTKKQFTYVKDENLKSALRFAFIDGAKWADKNPNSKTIAEYLYKEKGYPISLNGDIPTYEEVVKHVQAYNNYKMRQKTCDGLEAANAEPNLVSLWHDVSEEPLLEDKIIVFLDELNFAHISEKFGGTFSYMLEDLSWEEYVKFLRISKWAYISDLLPKGGER